MATRREEGIYNLQEQAKLSEFRGYTGKPIYSTWFGSETEQRAVFVDEVKCVGCLKCALFANKTFAIESVYGRARVVAQWADPEEKILDAIQTCPVDCISIVERSNLAALEFLMSKQPRGNVRMATGYTGGVRVSNIFADVDKFESRYHEITYKASSKESQDSDLQRESRSSAVHWIRSISNWWYWQAPTTGTEASSRKTGLSLTLTTRKPTQPNTKRLREAAANLRARETGAAAGRTPRSYKQSNEEYWTPMPFLPPPSTVSNTTSSSPEPPPSAVLEDIDQVRARTVVLDGMKMKVRVSAAMALVAAVIVGSRGGEMTGGGLTEHIGGTPALEVVNSSGLQVLLAGVTWFVIGLTVLGLVEGLGRKGLFRG